MVEVGGKLELELELYMSESEIDDDVTLEQFANADISEFGQCSMLKTQPTDIVAGEAIDFHAPLMN
ncbi:MAG: hypothetical protein MJ200_02625 [Mycoplasmoidaceae bacterium]|nr:hypothetical protein [Mycoplasmoidaceae bacterium]